MLNLEAQAGNLREIIVPVQPKHLTACRRLLQDGMLPRSVCSRSLLVALQPLFDTGIVHWEKAAGGQRLAVANLTGLERWFRQHFPETQTGEGITSSRIHAVAQFRDSKALPSNLPEIVCLRTTCDGGLLHDGQPVETTKATRQNGVFALTLTDQTRMQFQPSGFMAEIQFPAWIKNLAPPRLRPARTHGVFASL